MNPRKPRLTRQMEAVAKRKTRAAPLTPIEKQIKRYENYIAHARQQLSEINQQHAAKVDPIEKRLADYQEILSKLKA